VNQSSPDEFAVSDRASYRSLSTIPVEDEEDIVREIQHLKDAAWDAADEWREAGKKNFRYRDGVQRPDDLNAEGMYLIFNFISHRVKTKSGILTAGSPQAKVTGVDYNDRDTSRAFGDILEKGAKDDFLSQTVRKVVDDNLACGVGVFSELYRNNLYRWTNKGKKLGRLTVGSDNPMLFAWDPANRSECLDGDGAGSYYVRVEGVDLESLVMEYPELEYELEMAGDVSDENVRSPKADSRYGDYDETPFGGGSSGDTRQSHKREKVEIWYKKKRPVDTIFHKTSDGRWELAVDADDNLLTREQVSEIEMLDDSQEFKKRRKIVDDVWTACIVGDILLYNMKSPYRHNRFPHIFMGGQMKNDESMPRGEIERLVDAQDLYNRLMTMFVDTLSRTSHLGSEIDLSKVHPDQKDDVDVIMGKQGYKLHRAENAAPGPIVQWHDAAQQPQGVLQLADMVRALMGELFSLSDVQRGETNYERSGKAVIAMQRAADTALAGLGGALDRALTEWGRQRVENTIQFTRFRDAWRISDDVRNLSYKIVAEYNAAQQPPGQPGQPGQPPAQPGQPPTQQGQPGQPPGEMPEDAPDEIMNAPEPPEGYAETLGLRIYKDGKPGEPMTPDQNKFLVEDISSANLDVEVVLGSGEDRSEEEQRKIMELVFQATGDVKYLLEELEVKNADEILQRVEEKNQQKQMAGQVEELLQDDILGPLISMAMKDRENMRMGVQSGMTLSEMLGTPQQAAA
jgi:hypothetical protein